MRASLRLAMRPHFWLDGRRMMSSTTKAPEFAIWRTAVRFSEVMNVVLNSSAKAYLGIPLCGLIAIKAFCMFPLPLCSPGSHVEYSYGGE